MGVAIPLGYVEDRASGALIVDGSLRFTGSSYLKRTPGSTGNTTTYTISCWVKRSHLAPDGSGNTNSNSNPIFSAGTNAGSDTDDLQFYKDAGNNNAIRFVAYPGAFRFDLSTSMVFRDVSSWYHILANYDGTTAKIYINGTQVTAFASSTQNGGAGNINTTDQHVIGASCDGSTSVFRGYISQFYFIDGQALDPSYFGYTDPLTNTWRPKKLSSSVAFGTNGFFLPFDGSAPIGQDQSGRGNNWTPVNFGGSNTLEKATGALPILNTDGGGKVARVGVRTDSSASSLVLALPLVGVKDDVSNRINSGSTTKTVTATNAVASSAQSNFYGGSFYFDGSGDYLNAGTSTDFVFGTGQFTIEGWIYNQSYNGSNGGTGDSYPTIISTYSGETVNWIVRIYRTGALTWYSPDGGGTNNNSAGGLTQLNTWYHFAYVREGTGSNQFKMYLNGVLVHTLTDSNNYTANETVVIGSQSASNPRNYHTGYLQDFRIYKGLAKYTQNFIPASTDPDILPDTPSGVSYTSNLTQITDGAVAFDGSGDYLSGGSTNQFTTDAQYTIDGLVYISTAPSSGSGVLIFDTGSGGNDPELNIYNNGGNLQLYESLSNNTNWNGGAPYMSVGRWYYFKQTVNGTSSTDSAATNKLYLNGQLGVSNTINLSARSASSIFAIGARTNGTVAFNGFISNLRYRNVVDDSLTVPTSGFGTDSNTKLLCCQSNASAGAATSSPNISGSINNGTVWSSTTNTSLIYGGSASMIFDGNATWSVGNYANFNPGAFTLFSGANVTANTSIRVYANFAASDSFKINGATYTDNANGSEQWIVPSGVTYPITVNSIVIDTTGGSQNTISAVEIDGTILTDPVIVYGNAAATNFNPFTVNINTQRGKQSGWATFNPNQTKILGATDAPTLSDGNLTVAGTSSFTGNSVAGTIGVSSGKYYIEYTHLLGADANDTFGFGIRRDLFTGNYYDWEPYFRGTRIRSTADSGFYAASSGGSFSTITTTNDVIGIAFDIDNNYCSISVNGIIRVSSTSAGLSGYTWYPYAAGDGGGKVSVNFGQKPFKFPPPAGFQPLALANTPRPTIVRPDQYVGVTTYTGTGAASRPVTNLGFKPDFVWIKNRSSGSYSHQLFDSVRGASAGCLYSDLTNAQDSNFPITSFDTSGFTLGSSASLASQSYASQNGSGSNYVGWAWKAGGNSNTYNINDVGYATASAAGLTAGTITPTGASVNTKSGFSIITYTGNGTSGATVSHGLGNTPGLLIVKRRSNTGSTANWAVWHSSLTAGYNLFLNSTDNAQAYSPSRFTSTIPTSTVFSLGSGDETNYSGGTFVAYLWAEIPGFSKFGTYTGNGSTGADGPFVWIGFRPKWIMFKCSSSSQGGNASWRIFDAVRNPYNIVAEQLQADFSDAAASGANDFDFTSNGVKIRYNSSAYNASGATYIYMAFAETPTQNLYGAQANAR